MTNGTQLAAALVVVVDRNRRIRNRMYGGVGGWRGQLRLLPDSVANIRLRGGQLVDCEPFSKQTKKSRLSVKRSGLLTSGTS